MHVLADASPHVADAELTELEHRLHQAQADFRIADDLERVRESRPLEANGHIDYAQRASDYRAAFDRAGIRISDDAEAVAASIRASGVHELIEAALDDWAVVAFMLNDRPAVDRLLQIARSADPEPRWRDRFRAPAAWQSTERLRELADDTLAASPPPPGYQVALVGQLLRRKGAGNRDAQLLREACRRQPTDFWLSREMGDALFAQVRLDESAGYYRAALAVRPENAGVHEALGLVLFEVGQTDEELAEYRRAAELAPAGRSVRAQFVNALSRAGYWKEAADECRRALEADPKNPFPPLVLAGNLMTGQRNEDAILMFRRAIKIDPGAQSANFSVGLLVSQKGRHEEAAEAFRAETQMDPKYVAAHQMLANKLAAAGRPTEAITEFEAAIALEPAARLYLELGNLLRAQGRPEEAAANFRLAAASQPYQAWDALAAALLDQGRFAEARTATERFSICPGQMTLAGRTDGGTTSATRC